MKISFTLNGEQIEMDAPPGRRVVDLLREDLNLTGTKEGCGEGECGVCTILVDGESRLSCLMLVPQLEGRKVTTIEGVATEGRLHPIQEAFVELGAVQCGFCSPGMVLRAVDLLRKNPNPTRTEIREGISGNLCRCTGYQKIADAVEAAARRKIKEGDGTTGDTASFSPVTMRNVSLPHTLNDLWQILRDEPRSSLYAGGTDFLVKMRKGLIHPHQMICLERIDELKGVEDHGKEIFIGPCVTFTELLQNSLIREHFPVLINGLKVLGSPSIRNMGMIGGNIVTASPAGDTLPPLYVLRAELELKTKDSSRRIPIKDFIKGPGETDLSPSEVLTGIFIGKQQNFNLHHYEKVGQRKALAIAIVSLAALLKISKKGMVEEVRLAWGSVAPTIVTSTEIETMLIGCRLSSQVLEKAAQKARATVKPIGDIRASADYRHQVAGNLLLRLALKDGKSC